MLAGYVAHEAQPDVAGHSRTERPNRWFHQSGGSGGAVYFVVGNAWFRP